MVDQSYHTVASRIIQARKVSISSRALIHRR